MEKKSDCEGHGHVDLGWNALHAIRILNKFNIQKNFPKFYKNY